jgi:hypothetical protein
MKTFISIAIVTLLFSCSKTKSNEEVKQSSQTESKNEDVRVIEKQAEPDTLKGSLKARAIGSIGDVRITIDYHSPAVRGRVIWGGLVPFNNVWVTGAHRATSIDFDKEVVIGQVTVPAGKYALFTLPGKEEWTIIVNKNWDQHLADDYNQKEDIVRIAVKPETEETNQERLRYVIEEGEISIYWEKLKISLPITGN